MAGMVRSDAIAQAKQLLRTKLERHPDQGVRLLNQFAELPDDDPAVTRLADALVERSVAQ